MQGTSGAQEAAAPQQLDAAAAAEQQEGAKLPFFPTGQPAVVVASHYDAGRIETNVAPAR